MPILETMNDKHGNSHKILFKNYDVSESIKKEVRDIVLKADDLYEDLKMKYGKDKVYYNPKVNAYFLSL